VTKLDADSAAAERLAATAAQRAQVKEQLAHGVLPYEIDSPARAEEWLRYHGATVSMVEAVDKAFAGRREGRPANETLERIIGRDDLVSVLFLTRGAMVSAAVGAIGDPRGLFGTGFMITPRLLVTNHHVLPDEETARGCFVVFNFEDTLQGRIGPDHRYSLDPTFFVTSPEEALDYTLVAVVPMSTNGGPALSTFGYLRLNPSVGKVLLGEPLNIIQHPNGGRKEVAVRDNRLTAILDKYLHYEGDTNPGSSGSPVFNDQWDVVALHHSVANEKDANGNWVANEGIRISQLIPDVWRRVPAGDPRRALLSEFPASDGNAPSNERSANLVVPRSPVPNGLSVRPGPAEEDPVSSAPSTTWTLPLRVTVALGEPRPSVVPSPPRHDIEAVVRPDADYSTRPGYEPTFLPGYRVELPQLSPALQAKAARLNGGSAHTDPYQLEYQHFSIVMNAERRMAFFTAVNVDGSSWINIDRKTGEPREEAGEIWFIDPRLSEDAQCDQTLYADQQPRVFDRGHLVRRQDPAWDTPTVAQRANADTFHFTNCTPQEARFNERATYWAGIENYILKNATAERARVTVFTGPVFADDDPPYRYVKVPMAFWKVLARIEDGQLLSTALLAEQSGLIRRIPESLREDFSDLGSVAQYQTSVQEIERLTGLDFGPLREHDTYRPSGQEALRATKRPLRRFEDISLRQPMRGSAQLKGTGDQVSRPTLEAVDGTIDALALVPSDVLLYRGVGFVSRAIILIDGSPVSHAGLFLGGQGYQVGEALGQGLVQRDLSTSYGEDHEWVEARRMRNTPSTMDPVLQVGKRYLAHHDKYAYQQIVLLAFLCLTRKLTVTPILGVLVRRVLDTAASALNALMEGGRELMICSEYVYRAYAEALPHDPYNLQINALRLGGMETARRPLAAGIDPQSILGQLSEKPPRRDPQPAPGRELGTRSEAALGDPREIDRLAERYLQEVQQPRTAEAAATLDIESLHPSVVRLALAVASTDGRSSEITRSESPRSVFDHLFATAADFVTPGDLYRALTLYAVGHVRRPAV
jgi:endonuclease G